MKIITYSKARSSLKSVLDRVHEDADVTVITTVRLNVEQIQLVIVVCEFDLGLIGLQGA